MTVSDRFEHKLLFWSPTDDGTVVGAKLNALGAEGWEVVGLAPRGVDVPIPGMGATSIPEVVFVLKRRRA